STEQSPADVKARKPKGFDTGRAKPGRDVKPRTLEDLEPTQRKPARSPRGEGPTRAEQLEGLPLEKTSEVARRNWEQTLRPDYAKRLKIRAHEDIHHAIELQVLDKFPGAFTESELNGFDNMRGIPLEEPFDPNAPKPEVNARPKQLHNVAIRDRWDRFYADL